MKVKPESNREKFEVNVCTVPLFLEVLRYVVRIGVPAWSDWGELDWWREEPG